MDGSEKLNIICIVYFKLSARFIVKQNLLLAENGRNVSISIALFQGFESDAQ